MLDKDMLEWLDDRTEDETLALRVAVSRLPLTQRTLLLLYAEHRSLRKVAFRLCVSTTYVRRQLRIIRRIIKSQI